ncbi:MAG: zinc ribbon domain-containing protein [Oscillospiraceae bacterium]|nr:zinc ribbon domain-containing protein [Oscillospiraceae bacterium]
MAKFCRDCGTRLRDGAAFCPECGARVRDAAQQPAQRQPQQYQSPAQPQYYQPVRQPCPQPAKRKGSASRTAISILLVVAMLAEIAVTGFWFPGFFRSGESEPSAGERPTTAVAGEEIAIPTPEDGVFVYTDEEIANAPAVSMAVSPESTSASSGGFTVDFGPYNLDGADTFTVKTLPVHEDAAGGYTYQGFDLSLGSGTDRFVTEVQVRIPRDANDSDLVYFVSADPETGENKAEYYEISEDGKYYILYTTHFSLHEKMVIGDFSKALSEAVKAGDVSNQMTRDALSAFFYTALHAPDQVMSGTVWYNPQDLWAKMMNRYTYLPSSNSLLEVMARQMQSGGAQAVDFSSVLFNGVQQIQEKADLANSAKSVGDAGVEYTLRNLSAEGLAPGVKENLQKYSNWNTAHGLALARFSAISTAIGVLFLNDKIKREAADGKFATGEQVLKEHWTDYLSVVLGTISTGAAYVGAGAAAGSAAAIGAPIVAAGCAIGGLFLYFYGKSKETPYDALGAAERNYRDFFELTKTGTLYRTFFYDIEERSSPEFEGDPRIANDAYAVIAPIGAITPAQNEQLKQLLNTDMEKLNGSGGFTGFDPRTGVSRDFQWACGYLYRVMKDTPEKIGPAFEEFFRNYADACFYNLTDAEYLSFCREAMKQRGEDSNSASLPWTNQAEKEAIRKDYTDRYTKELFAACAEMFLLLSVAAQHEAQLKVDEEIRKEILPLLNTGVVITVEDKSLDNPKDFSKSIYCADPRATGIDTKYTAPDGTVYDTDYKYQYDYPLSFWTKDGGSYARVGAPVFLPAELVGGTTNSATGQYQTILLHQCSYDKFYPAQENFVPKLQAGTSNVVFTCSYFNYLLMGAPTVLGYKDVSQKNSTVQYVDFKVDPTTAVKESDFNVIRVNVELNGKKQETQTYKLQIQEDSSMFFERLRANDPDLPYDCTLTVDPDGNYTLDIPAISNAVYDRPCSREAFTITGKIISEHSDYAKTFKHGYIYSVSPSVIHSSAQDRNFAFDSFSSYIASAGSEASKVDDNYSHIRFVYDVKTGILENVEIYLHANRTVSYSDSKQEVTEKSGIFAWMTVISDQPSG